jgi:Protein of unknown function (DUF1553)/Protein of unknown function (DUF1549)
MRLVKRLLVIIGCSVGLLAAAEPPQKQFTAQQRAWWAFQKITNPAPPQVQDSGWVKTPVDAFILAKLSEKHLKPNAPADKITLLRRVTLDLTGLPPTPEEIQGFIADTSPSAYEKVVDRLLASPHYGERWARHWLDLARYADSEGFKSDETRPNIWRYRDYVIESFNLDKPYDRFIREQIAGDELYPNDPVALVATGFNRHFPDESNAANLMLRRQELLNDITDTVASTFMGLTYGCARCHDHKFDPILHKDYYRLQAFFANTRIEDQGRIESAEQHRAWQEKYAAWDEKTKDIRAEMHALAQPEIDKLYQRNLERFPEEIQAIINMPPKDRNPYQWQMYEKSKAQLFHSEQEAAGNLKGDAKKRYAELKTELAKYDSLKPADEPVAQAMIDASAQAPPTSVLSVGVYTNPLYQVEPGFLSILDPAPAKITPPSGLNSTGRRTALAEWLASPQNPLTPRVIVNRLWHYHFGHGIAGTPSDFGIMGERPTNKELLDYLASNFVENGWSMKRLHKLILLSSTYQQSSQYRADAAEIDPQDKYFWRYPRHRLEGETIRDEMLAVSGKLNAKMGGPGVFPPLPEGINPRGGWKKNESPSEANRRSVYIFVRRNVRYPMLESFDMPDTHESCARRNVTVTPTQSLALLNSNLVLDWAHGFAERVLNDKGLSPEAQVDRAYKLAYGRTPSDDERRMGLDFLKQQERVAGTWENALADFCHVLLNSNEFLYVN